MPGDIIIEHGDPYRELVILTRGAARSVPGATNTLDGDGRPSPHSSPRASMQEEKLDGKTSPRIPGGVGVVGEVAGSVVGGVAGKLNKSIVKSVDYRPKATIVQGVRRSI